MIAIRREIVEILYDFYRWSNAVKRLNFKEMYSGWGLDTIYNSLAIYMNKKIYRDHVTMHHPFGSSYSGDAAYIEMDNILRAFLEYAELLDFDCNVLSDIQKVITDKVISRKLLSIKDVYLRMESEFTA
jgi:hypothetical protein